jgi:carbamoyl-phosphate synthase large subunit
MVIAGGEWQVPLIRTAKAMGLFVINSNLYPDSPGFRYADVGLVADVLDREKNLAFAHEYKPDGVVTDQTDISVPTVAYLCEQLGLPGIGRGPAQLFTNKFLMREFLRQRGYPAPEYLLCKKPEDALGLAAKIGYPIVLKPPANQGSRGVFRVDSEAELPGRYADSVRASHDGDVIAERFIPGEGLTVEGFKTLSRHYSLAVSRRETFAHNPMLGAVQIYSFTAEDIDFESLKQQHNSMVEEMGLNFGITHAEYILSNGKFFLVEVAARGGGSGTSSHVIPAMSGVETNELLIRMSLGERIDALAPSARTYGFAMISFLNFQPGLVKAICGMDKVRGLPGLLHISLNFGPGERLDLPRDGSSRQGSFIAVAQSLEELQVLQQTIRRELRVTYA